MAMVLEDKREAVLRCVKLGLTLDAAFLIAECTDDEITALSEDADFKCRATLQAKLLEHNLLKKLDECIALNTSIGKSDEVRWLLGKINPSRWGNGKEEGQVFDLPPMQVVEEA
jgi:hypothetical protein